MISWSGGLLMLFTVSVYSKSVFDGTRNEVTDHEPALAMVCGKVTQHKDLTTGRWISGSRDCIESKQEMLDYCKEIYPTLKITNILEESETVHVSSWCHLGSSPPCRGHGHNVRPVKCVEGHYEPKALDVKKGCAFEHKIDYESCHLPEYWEETAMQYCGTKGKRLSDPQMLKPCAEVDQWNGVQFLCCGEPDTSETKTREESDSPAGMTGHPSMVEEQSVNPICLQPKEVGLCRALLPAWHFNRDSGECQFFQYGGCGGNDNNFDSKEECMEACPPGNAGVISAFSLSEPSNSFCGLPPDQGLCRAFFPRLYYDAAAGACKSFVYGGCGGNDNKFMMLEDCEAKCKGYTKPVQVEPPVFFGPGPVVLNENMKPAKVEEDDTTVAPVTSGLDQFATDRTTINNEHDVFADNMEAIKAEHQAKVDEILKKWDEDNSKMPQGNLEQLDEMEENLQLTISTLEDEYDGRMEDLNQRHMARMDSLVEDERAKTLQKFFNEMKADKPKVHRVLSALKKYIAVERQDKSHTMQHYFMAINDEFDTDSIPDFKQRLNEIDERVNQTRVALQEHPNILQLIQDEAEEILSEIPESPDFESDGMDEDDEDLEEDVGTTTMATPITTIKYDAGGIPDPDNNLPAWEASDKNSIQSSLSDEDVLEDLKEDVLLDESIMNGDVDRKYDVYGGRLFNDEYRPAALVKTDSIKEASGTSSWVIWSCLGIGLLVVIVAAIAMALRRNQIRPPLRIVVEKPEEDSERELSPEEKQLLSLQQNGYENPTYKFFEKQAA